jgi:hypothetical protein
MAFEFIKVAQEAYNDDQTTIIILVVLKKLQEIGIST